MDTDVGTELFASYTEDFNLCVADIASKLDVIAPLQGEQRKASLRAVERSIDEAKELIGSMELETQNVPTVNRGKVNAKLRAFKSTLDKHTREQKKLAAASDRSQLFSGRDVDLESQNQRDRMLAGTQRLENSSTRLQSAHRTATDTEGIGAGILNDLRDQRDQILHTRSTLMEADGYVDKSVRTLKSMGRRMITNKLITYAIITILVFLILLVLYSKFK